VHCVIPSTSSNDSRINFGSKAMHNNSPHLLLVMHILHSPSTAANYHYLGRCIWMALLIFRRIRRIINGGTAAVLDGGGMEYILQ
jgi:hypothetical protein